MSHCQLNPTTIGQIINNGYKLAMIENILTIDGSKDFVKAFY